MSRSLRAALPWRLSGNVLCIDTYTHTHTHSVHTRHTHAHHFGLHKQTPAGCSCLFLAAICVLLLPQCGHIFTLRATDVTTTTTALPALVTTATPSPTASPTAPATPSPAAPPAPVPAPFPATVPAAAPTPTSTSFHSCCCSASFSRTSYFPAVYFLQVARCGCLVVAFSQPRGWLLTGSGCGQSSSPPPSHCFYLNSLPFAVQLVQFGRVIQIPQAVGGSRGTCYAYSHPPTATPTPTPTPTSTLLLQPSATFA